MNPSTPQLQFHQKVNTPYGPGLVQGEEFGTGAIIVSHDLHDPAVAEVIKDKDKYLHGIWVVERYTLEQLTPFK